MLRGVFSTWAEAGGTEDFGTLGSACLNALAIVGSSWLDTHLAHIWFWGELPGSWLGPGRLAGLDSFWMNRWPL